MPLPTTNRNGIAAQADHGRSNILRLALCQALAGANSTVVFATGAVIGDSLAPSKALATLPITVFVIGMAAGTLPAGALAQRYGRRSAFLMGAGCGILVGLLAAAAIDLASFALFCAGMFFGGVYAAVVLSFRFSAADCVPPMQRPGALSAVMAGGVLAGILGPQLVTYTMHLWSPHTFAVTYLAQAAIALLSGIILWGVKLPPLTIADRSRGRPLALIARQPRFVVAVLCGVISYLLMNLIMTSAPLAMKMCGLPLTASNLGLQWHVIAMYAPSFFTGRLITRFGAPQIVMTGLLLTAVSIAAGLTGVDVTHFWLTLALLGMGWNFGFVGASALVLECHRPEERAKVQSLNDFVVFGIMVVGSFASGGLLTGYGWSGVCLAAIPPLLLAAVALVATDSFRSRTVETC
ncbi:MAG: MFS transporter [Nevskia sp.]|nr:MFS transporter [Nevskia sp.]